MHGVVVGSATVFLRRRAARLYSFAVHPDFRRRWVGVIMLKRAEKFAVSRACRIMRLEVRDDNKDAIRFYRRAKYNVIGSHPSYYYDGATALKMEKEL